MSDKPPTVGNIVFGPLHDPTARPPKPISMKEAEKDAAQVPRFPEGGIVGEFWDGEPIIDPAKVNSIVSVDLPTAAKDFDPTFSVVFDDEDPQFDSQFRLTWPHEDIVLHNGDTLVMFGSGKHRIERAPEPPEKLDECGWKTKEHQVRDLIAKLRSLPPHSAVRFSHDETSRSFLMERFHVLADLAQIGLNLIDMESSKDCPKSAEIDCEAEQADRNRFKFK